MTEFTRLENAINRHPIRTSAALCIVALAVVAGAEVIARAVHSLGESPLSIWPADAILLKDLIQTSASIPAMVAAVMLVLIGGNPFDKAAKRSSTATFVFVLVCFAVVQAITFLR